MKLGPCLRNSVVSPKRGHPIVPGGEPCFLLYLTSFHLSNRLLNRTTLTRTPISTRRAIFFFGYLLIGPLCSPLGCSVSRGEIRGVVCWAVGKCFAVLEGEDALYIGHSPEQGERGRMVEKLPNYHFYIIF
jgi:hypothetical protein